MMVPHSLFKAVFAIVSAMNWLIVGLCSMCWSQSTSTPNWLIEAPGEIVRLIDKGQVEIQVDDARLRQAGKSALTLFRFGLDFDYKFRAEWVESGTQSSLWKARITAWIDQPKLRPQHTLCVRSNFTPLHPWKTALMQHEMDHVAISTDPRLVKIIQRVLQRRKTWLEPFEQQSKPSEAELRKRVEADVRKTLEACESMIQAQYDLLDKVTKDGLSQIDDRREFFEGLYSVDGLDRVQFAYREEVRSFVKDRLSNVSTKKEVAEHYQFVLP